MKKILFLITMLLCMVSATTFAHDIEVKNDDGVTIYYRWTNNNTELEVSYRGSNYNSYSNEYSGNVVIPSSVTYNGSTYSVTSIGYYAFYNCSGLTSVTIPNSVTSIGNSAFSGCSGLTSVTIPNSVTSIGEYAFQNCSGLTSVTIGTGVKSIGYLAFYGCNNLTSVHISDIAAWCKINIYCSSYWGGAEMFNPYSSPLYCAGHLYLNGEEIRDLVIPNSVTSIGGSAFSGCSSLTSITIPNSVTSIGSYAFYECSGLTSVTIPNSVTSIGGGAFSGCSGLTSVTIPNSVTSIGDYAFEYCSGLTSVTIPGSVTSMGSSPFSGCSGITLVKVPVTDLASFCENKAVGLIYSNIGKPVQLIDGDATEIKEYVVPDGVASIGSSAFRNCTGLTSVTIPNSVTSIGDYAFCECSGLTSVTIPNSVTSIGSGAFYKCSGLTSVTIPNSVTSIGREAFYGCSGLTSVTIPNSVTSIGTNAFSGCTALMTVKSYITVPFDVGKFSEETYHNGTLYVPNGTKDLYIRFDGWREFLNIVEMGEEPAPNGQCAKPSIIIAGKEMRYECETPDAEFESILTTEEQRFGGNKLVMENKDLVYILTVYATAPGYDRSEPAQVKFIVSRNDVNQDGTVDVADIATIISAMASKSREEREE